MAEDGRHLGVDGGERVAIVVAGAAAIAEDLLVFARVIGAVDLDPVAVGRVHRGVVDDDVALEWAAFRETRGLIVVVSGLVEVDADEAVCAPIVAIERGGYPAVAIAAVRSIGLYEQPRIGPVRVGVDYFALAQIVRRAIPSHVGVHLSIEVQVAIGANAVHQAKIDGSDIVELVRWLGVILHDDEGPLRCGSEWLCEVDMRGDRGPCCALSGQRREDGVVDLLCRDQARPARAKREGLWRERRSRGAMR